MSFTMGLSIAGAFIMAAALIPISMLIKALPSGGLKRGWYGLASMVVAFVGSYIIVAFSHPGFFISWVFLFGSIFVLAVSILSQRVAHFANRITILEKENVTDPLMQIYNRRFLDTRLRREFRRSVETDRSLSVLLLDIDHFKRVNDSLGHLSGDSVLRQLGPLVAQSIRTSDVVARYGGEEIVILARDTNSHVASVLAERIRLSVAATKFYSATESAGEVTPIRITASIGVSTLQKGDNIAALVRRADEALYIAKSAGRNQVSVSGQLPAVPTMVTGESGRLISAKPPLGAVYDHPTHAKAVTADR